MISPALFSPLLENDPSVSVESALRAIQAQVGGSLKRRGAVVAVSGGIDSSVCLALCARALGPANTLALGLPDRHSSPESAKLAESLAKAMGVRLTIVNIDPVLDAAGTFRSQLEAVRMTFSDATEEWSYKIVMPSILDGARLNVPRLVVRTPGDEEKSERMSAPAYLQLVAATNFKQRTRTMTAYYHADRLNYAVCGTPNRLEYDQGFFVKGGDGLADFKPIAHLYKSQVYAVARAVGVPEEIIARTPTTDTFSLPQTQEEFYFSVPYRTMDICLFALNNGIPAGPTAQASGLTEGQVQHVWDDIRAKRRTTRPLHMTGLTVEDMKLEPV
jgi:NAD+ synthase